MLTPAAILTTMLSVKLAAPLSVLFLTLCGDRATGQAIGSENDLVMDHVASTHPDVLSRRRRFIGFKTSGYSASVYISTFIPIPDLSTGLSLGTPFAYSFDSGRVTGKRSVSSDMDEISATVLDRFRVLAFLEEYLPKMINPSQASEPDEELQGRACVLRTICEVAMVPNHRGGLLNDALNLLLVPESQLEDLPRMAQSNEYVVAQRAGAVHKDCSQYERDCNRSLFKFAPRQKRKNCRENVENCINVNATRN